MPKFDTKTFFELTGEGASPVQSLGTAFGMPSCLINLGAEALNLLPTSVLGGIRGAMANGAARADDVVKALTSKLRFLDGVIEYDTEDGLFRFVSDSSTNGVDKDGGGFLGVIGDFLGAAGAAAGFAGRLYNNYQSTVAAVESIQECLQSYKDYLDYTGAAGADKRQELSELDPDAYQRLLDNQFGVEAQEAADAMKFKADSLAAINSIDSIIGARIRDPNLEPEFLCDYATLLGDGFRVECEPPEKPREEIFRLEFGPPKSTKGKFILSIDGLYYDSQTSGIIPALLELEFRKSELRPEQDWKLEYDPSLGGRGTPTTSEGLSLYVNTILDTNILDESNFLKNYYDQDNLLVDLIGQKNRKIYDISSTIGEFVRDGESQVLIANLRQVMLSESSHFLDKINKRKKQIELAVKLPVIYGGNSAYTPGNVPVNDFSYLEGINFLVDIEKQRKIVLDQADVSGVVLPLEVKFTQQIESFDPFVIEHLIISNLASGTVIDDPSGVNVPQLSLTQTVESDKLIALYNLLTAKTDSTSSTDFRLHNSSSKGIDYNAQLVGNVSSIFNRGLGISYLEGIVRKDSGDNTISSAVGSYIKIPQKPEFQDFIYNKNGATFETWTHVPELDGSRYGFNYLDSVSGLYRLILSNENTGLQTDTSSQGNILNLVKDDGTSVVRGMIFGFTRDRRFTQNVLPSNLEDDNKTDRLALVLAPTQSFDSSSVGFINRSYSDSENCYDTSAWHGMVVDVWDTINGKSLSSCGREFCQLSVTFDPPENAVKIFMDGVLLATSSYNDVFGADPRTGLPNIPSLKKDNSFEYNSTNLSSTSNSADLRAGPKLGTYFTPWILGGGYTDGHANGFMGGEFGGQISGLKGYLGNVRFYSKPLSPSQVLNNYNATKNFFKNIEVPNLMWEPIDIE